MPPLVWSSREKLLASGQKLLGDYEKENHYGIEKVGPEGKGVVAARDFGVGVFVMLERPAILKPQMIPGFNAAEIEKLIDRLLARLPEDVYLALSNCKPEPETLLSILRTNCVTVTFPDTDVLVYQAVAIDLSRCNHRCASFC